MLTLVVRTEASWHFYQPCNYQGYELAHPNIHPICDLLEHVKGLVPADPKLHDVHNTGQQQDNLEEFQEGPALTMQEKPEASNQTNGYLQ